MRANKLSFIQFRNLKSGEFLPDENVNVIYGDNGHGKTNLLEAIWLFTGARSFRYVKDNELINFNNNFSRLTLDFFAQNRKQQAELRIEKRRSAILNGVGPSNASCLIGNFCAVVFSPTHLSLIKNGPNERRRFIDAAICQVVPKYSNLILSYNKILQQRNALLKSGQGYSNIKDTIDIWNEKLALSSGEIYVSRRRYINKLNSAAQSIYSGLAGNEELFNMKYFSANQLDSDNAAQFAQKYLDLLNQNINIDLNCGFTTCGVQKDDIDITINGHSIRTFGSQGQQRSAVLAMKLAEAELLKNISGELPVAILDDVMSELDINRQDYILHHLKGWQVFISCCDPAPVMRLTHGKAIKIKNGVLYEE